jgi:hypothetical protein
MRARSDAAWKGELRPPVGTGGVIATLRRTRAGSDAAWKGELRGAGRTAAEAEAA